MFLEYYNLDITETTYFKFTNVYRHLTVINNDVNYNLTIKQGEKLLSIIKPLQSITLLDVFNYDKNKKDVTDRNPMLTLIAGSGGSPMNIEIYNYGA